MIENRQNLSLLVIKNKFISYIKSFRLSFWFLVSIFFLLGEWYSIQRFPVNQTVIVLLSLLGIFSAGSMINIVFDKKIDVFARKPIVKVFIHLSAKEMLFTSVFLSFISLFLLYFFINVNVFLLGFIIVIIGIFYSTPPIRLKTKPPLDCIMNAIGGSLPFFMGWMIISTSLTFESIILGLIIFLFILHTFFFFTTSDIDVDKEMGIKTSCTIIGLKNCILAGIIIYIIDLLIAIYFFDITHLLLICFVIYIPLIFFAFIYKNKRIHLVNIVGGRTTSIFAGTLLILLSISSKNIFPIFFLSMWIILTINDIFVLLKVIKKSKS